MFDILHTKYDLLYFLNNPGGLHFVMGDGGISVAGQENIQEILTKQLLLCQFACALSVLRQGTDYSSAVIL